MKCGIELEYADWDRRKELPDGAKWNMSDNTVVNSTGIANDDKNQLYFFGGEANTRPTSSISEQVKHIERIIDSNTPAVNYRCNLHIHIEPPWLKENLIECKRLFNYFQESHKRIFELVEPLPLPILYSGVKGKWEKKRYSRMQVSHHYVLPEARAKKVMAAETPEEFLNEHAPMTEKGRMWYFSPRPAMNMRQLWETGTIEFRHFPGTLNLREIESALEWCWNVVTDLPDPDKLFESSPGWKFPKFEQYNYEMEQGYQWTNVAHNPRRGIEKRLNDLRREVDIDNIKTPLKDIYECIIRLRGEYQPIDSGGSNLQEALF